MFVGYKGHQKGYKCYHPPTTKYYVTMDVTFFEDMSYYTSSDSALQGEHSYFEELYHGEGETCHSVEVTDTPEVQGQDDDRQAPPDDSGIIAPEIALEIQESDAESVTAPPSLPDVTNTPDSCLPDTEDLPSEVSNSIGVDTSDANSRQYVLPNRSTRGKQAKKYEPTLQAKAKYPVANFMSTKRLSKSYESFVNQISAVSVPNKVQDALGDPK